MVLYFDFLVHGFDVLLQVGLARSFKLALRTRMNDFMLWSLLLLLLLRQRMLRQSHLLLLLWNDLESDRGGRVRHDLQRKIMLYFHSTSFSSMAVVATIGIFS